MSFKVRRNLKRDYEILKQKRKVYSILILAVFVLIFLFVWEIKIKNIEADDTTLYMCNRESSEVVGEILNGDEIAQEVTVPFSKIKGLTFMTATYGRMCAGKLEVSLSDNDDNVIYSEDIECEELKDNSYFSIYFDNPIKVNADKKYKIVIKGKGTEKGTAPTIYTSDGDWYLDNDLYINNVADDNDLVFGLYGNGNSNLPYEMYIYMAAVIFIFLIFILYNYVTVRRICIEKIFVVSMIFWGVFYGVLMPPMTAPDEADHFISSYAISNAVLGEEVMSDTGQIWVRAQDNRMYDKTVTLQTYQYFYNNFWQKGSNTPSLYSDGEVEYREMNGIMYVPQVIGITLARLFKWGYKPMLFMGRAVNLLFYIVAVFWAIKIAPVGKQMFFVISHFPMVLELVNSYSPDAMLLGVVFLYIAYILYLVYEKDTIKWYDILIMFLLAIIFIPIKIAYLPIIGICFLIPTKKFTKKRYFILTLISLCAASMVPLFVNKFNSYMVEVTTDNIIDWSQTEGFIVADLLENPGCMINILFNTMMKKSDEYFLGMIGRELGWLNTHMPVWVIFGFFILFLISILRQSDSEEYEIGTWKRVWVTMIYIGTYLLILIAMLFGWTTKEQDFVEGIQGRYFLPILPLCLLMFRNKIVCLRERNDYIYIVGAAALNIFAVLCIYLFAMNADSYMALAGR